MKHRRAYEVQQATHINGVISEFRLPFPVLLDEMGHVTDHLYNVFGLPVSVFIDRDGKISRVVIGGLFQDEIDGYIAEIPTFGMQLVQQPNSSREQVTQPMAIRVILADDHAVVRKGIRDFLEEAPGIEVVAEAGDGAKVKELILLLRPDVVVLDVRMPEATGIEVTSWIREQDLPVRILILSAYDDDVFVVAALKAGANGYVLKNAEADEITAAVRAVYNDQAALAPDVARKLMMYMSKGGPSEAAVEPLSEREREVLQLAAMGMTNRAIGLKLSISDRTVQGHLASIYAKFHVGSRTEAVTKGFQFGIIHLPESNE